MLLSALQIVSSNVDILRQANSYTVLTNSVEKIGFVNVEEIQFSDTSIPL